MSQPKTSMPDAVDANRLIVVLFVLAIGCNKHPAYRAVKPPRAACSYCHMMWAMSQEIRLWDSSVPAVVAGLARAS